MSRTTSRGFTLLEVTVAVLLASGIAYILYATLAAGTDVLTAVSASQQVHSNVDGHLERIARELRGSGKFYRDETGLYWEDYYAENGYTGYSTYSAIYPLLYDWYATPGNWSYYIYFRQNQRVSFPAGAPVVHSEELWGPIIYYGCWLDDGESANGQDDDNDGYIDERGLWRYEYSYWTNPYRYVYKKVGANLEYVRFTWANPEQTAVRIQIRAAKRRGILYRERDGSADVRERETAVERTLVVFLRND